MQTIRSKMILALVVPIAVLVPVAALTAAATTSTHRASRAVQRSADILDSSQRLLLAAVDSETGVRGYIITADTNFLGPYDKGTANFDAEVATLRRTLADAPAQLARLEKVVSIEMQWRAQVAEPEIAAIRASNGDVAAAKVHTGQGKALKDQVRAADAELVAAERAVFDHHIAASERAATRARFAALAGPALVGTILLVLVLVLSRNITGRLATVAAGADALAAGDLTRRVRDTGHDEIARLGEAFNAMAARLEETTAADSRRREALQQAIERCSLFSARVAGGDLTARIGADGDGDVNRLYENLNSMVADLATISGAVRRRATEIGQASSGVLAAVSQHASTANQQSAAIAEIATTVSEVRMTAEQTAARAAEVATLAQSSVQAGDNGLTTVRAVVDGMTEIRATLDRLATTIGDLSEQAGQINEIIATVADLADQSNLLALNASIEAARAGEQGRGFAVVAAEVRSLADQSKEATAAVRTILGEIQRATNAVVVATEAGARTADERSGQAEAAGGVIAELTGVIHQAAQAAQVIAVSAHEQRVGMDQVALAMNEIRDSSTAYAEGSGALQQSAAELDAVAGALRDLAARYRVEPDGAGATP
ncbi:MAG TPA: methyl-accepting chemotaxis protein [Acidimicrobiia bacterium]|nr:methyl-accepting chemotaxis protein [Acidimicrobiia bacterium]